jgi:hypothetical protein
VRILRAWLAVLCTGVFLVAPAGAQTAPAISGGPDLAILRGIESQVSQIRGLDVLAEPDLRVMDHTALRKYLIEQLDRDYLPSEREIEQKQYVLLGLIKPSDDLFQIQLDLLGDQVIGVYDSDTKSLVVVGDQGKFGPVERVTYAHEFNHALQDQHYGLNQVAPKHSGNNDRSLAVHAVMEGDAIMLQSLWALANLNKDEVGQLVRASSGGDDSLTRAPMIVRTELLFRYVEGFSFVRQYFREAGNNYAAIDDLFNNPPESTAQVIHLDKYRNRVHPVNVALGDLSGPLGPNWRSLGQGVLGELDTRVLLEQWGTERADAARVASGWTGDRWQLFDKDGRSAIVIKSTWESPDAARSFFSAYSAGLRRRFDSALTEESTVTRQALTTPVSATDLQLQGNEVLSVIAFDRDSATAIVDAVRSSAL